MLSRHQNSLSPHSKTQHKNQISLFPGLQILSNCICIKVLLNNPTLQLGQEEEEEEGCISFHLYFFLFAWLTKVDINFQYVSCVNQPRTSPSFPSHGNVFM